MKAFLPIALTFLLPLASFSQDERYYRKIFTGELKEKPAEKSEYKVVVESKKYNFDLNGDKKQEEFQIEKKDGIDFFVLFNHFGQKIFEKKLPSIGFNSRLMKVQLVSVTDKENALILHFYEGAIESTKFQASARIFFVSFPKNDLTKMSFYKGPHFFNEKEDKDHSEFWLRRYSVNAIDYNKDGKREISVSYNKISRIYFYMGEGVWRRL